MEFFDLAVELSTRIGVKKLILFVGMARRIWHRRNDVIHGVVFMHPNEIVRESRLAVEDFKNAQQDTTGPPPSQAAQNRSSWMAPMEGWYKTNWDVAISKEKGLVGMGIVVRDWTGKFVAARSLTKPGFMEPTTGEALASYYAAFFSRDIGIQNLILECDAMKVIQALNSNALNLSRYGHM